MTTPARASTIPMQHARVRKDFGGKGVEEVSAVLIEITYTHLLQLNIHIYCGLLMLVRIIFDSYVSPWSMIPSIHFVIR